MSNHLPNGFPVSKEIEALKDVLWLRPNRSEYGKSDSKPFLSDDFILASITYTVIRQEMKLQTGDDEDLVLWIASEAPRLFATASCSLHDPQKLRAAMVAFKEYKPQLNDTNLDSHIFFREEISRDGGLGDKLGLGSFSRIEFSRLRWCFLVPVLRPQEYWYTLKPENILPIIWKGKASREGGYGDVCRIEIHTDHWKHEVPQDMIAIKRITLAGNNVGEQEAAWRREAEALALIKKWDSGLTSHIINCLAAIEQGEDRYFLFPWADGGDLRDYWRESPRHSRRAPVIRDAIEQLRGLADALHLLHNNGRVHGGQDDELGEDNIRHGDIKPENILRFVEGHTKRTARDGNELGLLKIADMGLAKRHTTNTNARNCITSSPYGTLRYTGPEHYQGRGPSRPLSRLFDIWSMGCVVLDFVVWILHGNDGLEKFAEALSGSSTDKYNKPYFNLDQTTDKVDNWAVDPVVTRWINHMLSNDPECRKSSAIRDLLLLVQNKLLVVELPGDHKGPLVIRHDKQPEIRVEPSASTAPVRATAQVFRDELDAILARIDDPNNEEGDYLLIAPDPGELTITLPGQSMDTSGMLAPPQQGLPGISQERTVSPRYNENRWDFLVDNQFARDYVLSESSLELYRECLEPQRTVSPELCRACRHLIFWSGGFSLEGKPEDFSPKTKAESGEVQTTKSDNCDFCDMMRDICERAHAPMNKPVIFPREMSRLSMRGHFNSQPVISLLRGRNRPDTDLIQIGFPRLPSIGRGEDVRASVSTTFSHILLSWLKECDDTHKDCRSLYKTALPTRLIDVGAKQGDKIRLYLPSASDRSSSGGQISYIALSHPWGSNDYKRFVTRNKADETDFKREIQFDHLPQTFKDAVVMTRALKQTYLWIDSICILQDDEADKAHEMPRMEYVYSSAYCVLAASRAIDQRTGFLHERKDRKFVQFPNGVYACEPLDDFREHVLNGPFNKRAWVLQERALARRTIFFTDAQAYFECGAGIRCETLGKIKNAEAAFLGDPNFPSKSLQGTRGERIRDFTTLFSQYSRLDLSFPKDRPNAVAGLERRLRRAYNSDGGAYGIFGDGGRQWPGLFHRSLLWRRGKDTKSLAPIPEFMNPFTVTAPPSWSWTRLAGGIDYLAPTGGQYEWQTDLVPVWTTVDQETVHGPLSPYIKVVVRQITAKGLRDANSLVVFDVENDSRDREPRILDCVVIAKPKGQAEGGQSYVLIVESTAQVSDDVEFYFRVGVGHVSSSFLSDVVSSGRLY